MNERPIGIVTPLYAPAIGGVERHVERLAGGLAARGLHVEVLTTDPDASKSTVTREGGLTIRRFPTLGHEQVYLLSPSLMRYLWGNAGRYRLIHAHNLHTPIPVLAGFGARHAAIPYVITPHFHGSGHTPLRRVLHAPYRPLAARSLRRAARIVFNSAAEQDVVQREFGRIAPSQVIPPGVDIPPNRFGADEKIPERVLILSVGRLEAYKQVDALASALANLPQDHDLVVVGGGGARAAILQAAETVGVGKRLTLLGHVSSEELTRLYHQADAFASLSLHEAFGLTLLEAAGAGCPVVASDIPAHREVSRYVPSGRIVLVAPDARGADLARAIETAVRAGRVPVPESPAPTGSGWRIPTWDGLVEGVLRVYDDALHATGSPGPLETFNPGSPRVD